MNHTINETINQTLNQTVTTQSFSEWITGNFLPTLFERIMALLTAPFEHPQMIYIITPMLITLFLMEFYFGRYEDEELGWNTAVGNALVLVFVAVDLLKTTYPQTAPVALLSKVWGNITNFQSNAGDVISTFITIAIFALGFLLLFTNFFHFLPKGLAFFISGSLPINVIAYLGIVIVYTNNTGLNPVPIDWYTLLSAILLFFTLMFFFGIVHVIEPKKHEFRPANKSDENSIIIEESE